MSKSVLVLTVVSEKADHVVQSDDANRLSILVDGVQSMHVRRFEFLHQLRHRRARRNRQNFGEGLGMRQQLRKWLQNVRKNLEIVSCILIN